VVGTARLAAHVASQKDTSGRLARWILVVSTHYSTAGRARVLSHPHTSSGELTRRGVAPRLSAFEREPLRGELD
jgi:hypothetical protein